MHWFKAEHWYFEIRIFSKHDMRDDLRIQNSQLWSHLYQIFGTSFFWKGRVNGKFWDRPVHCVYVFTKLVIKCSFLKQSLPTSTVWNFLRSKPSYNNVLGTSFFSFAGATTCLGWWQKSKYYADYVGTADYAGTADNVGTWEWAQLDLQSIQHRDYFGHLSFS